MDSPLIIDGTASLLSTTIRDSTAACGDAAGRGRGGGLFARFAFGVGASAFFLGAVADFALDFAGFFAGAGFFVATGFFVAGFRVAAAFVFALPFADALFPFDFVVETLRGDAIAENVPYFLDAPNIPSSYSTISPATAEAATVSGDARNSLPGPERPL